MFNELKVLAVVRVRMYRQKVFISEISKFKQQHHVYDFGYIPGPTLARVQDIVIEPDAIIDVDGKYYSL